MTRATWALYYILIHYNSPHNTTAYRLYYNKTFATAVYTTYIFYSRPKTYIFYKTLFCWLNNSQRLVPNQLTKTASTSVFKHSLHVSWPGFSLLAGYQPPAEYLLVHQCVRIGHLKQKKLVLLACPRWGHFLLLIHNHPVAEPTQSEMIGPCFNVETCITNFWFKIRKISVFTGTCGSGLLKVLESRIWAKTECCRQSKQQVKPLPVQRKGHRWAVNN